MSNPPPARLRSRRHLIDRCEAAVALLSPEALGSSYLVEREIPYS